MGQNFEGDINEFVDWISGYNQEEDTDHTNGKAVSGKSIRELLQGRLQRPVYMERDDVNGEIRLFSSEHAYNLWKDDPTNHGDLMLGSFPIPHGYGIYLYDKDNDGNLIQTGLNNTLYLKYGDTTSEANLFKKYFKVFDSNGEMNGKAVTARLTITAPGFADDIMLPRTFEPGQEISFDISQHLHKGVNTILVDLSSNISGRTYKESQLQYTVNVLELQASTPYQYNLSDGNQNSNMEVTLSVKNTNCSDYTAFYKLDDNDPVSKNVSTVNEKSDANFDIDISSLSEGVHVLQLKFTINVLNNGISRFIDSNIVYIRFVKYKSDSSSRHNILTYISIDGSNGNTNNFLSMDTIPTLYLTQYSKFELSYSLASSYTRSTRKIRWDLKQLQNNEYVTVESYESTADKEILQSLIFTPTIYGEEGIILEGYLETDEANVYTKELSYNVIIKKANIQIAEKSGYKLKLENTSGYSNANISNHKWTYKSIECLFNRESTGVAESPAFPWNSLSGWGKNCMHLSPGDYVFIDHPFFTSVNGKAAHTPGDTSEEKGGITVEIEFEFRSVTNPNDPIIVIGGEANKCKIVFTPNSAAIYADSGEKIRETNFKANERIKLAFVIYPNAGYGDDTSLATIVNNGIFERANNYASNTFTSAGKMKIGKANAGADIYIYRIRAYDYALTNEELFCNFAIDSDDKSAILERNNILATNGSIDYKSTLNKLPVILIKGNLQKIIDNKTKDLNLNVDLSKVDTSNSDKDFYITNCRIRRHGQSTLNYPIPSFKIWSNSKFKVNVPDTPNYNDDVQAKMYGCLLDDQNYPIPDTSKGEKYKGRYQMRSNSVPANKWVLQANYADSSGVHNGGIMRLIQEAWYNALVAVPGKNQPCYKLRTPPQLISSINVKRENLDESDFYATDADKQLYQDWVNAYRYNPNAKKKSMYEYNNDGTVRLWSECNNLGKFPYEIKVAPDSFPCALFYRVSDNSPITFLGQYVFMDDKKSDFVFGERSIYKVKGDPFCQTKNYKDFDTDANRLWNNKNCVRVEIVQINTELVGYRSHTTEDGHSFSDLVQTYKMNENSEYVDEFGEVITDLSQLSSRGVPTGEHLNWTNGFELVYPDVEEEDLDPGEDYNTVLNAEMQPFARFHEWLTGTYQSFLASGGTQELLNAHREDHNYPQGFHGFDEFQRTAKDHLNLYLLAGYYICFLRFGLVDSVERNAQPKTYDGQHWHYEPWDMDIAMGNKNTGGIKWNPPVTRMTNDGSIAAFSGTHVRTQNNQVFVDKSSWLWDALEAWDEFRDIVKAVAEALSATLTYDHICKVLDEEYAARWCERMYNISGHIKYIETQGSNMYDWMQGARTSHRHWWLKTSMDFYDAKWVCGDFKTDFAYINIKHTVQGNPLQIGITPSNEGYFCYGVEREAGEVTMSEHVTHINGGESGYVNIPVGTNLEAKSRFYLYGASNIKKLDLSNVYRESDRSGGIENMFFGKISETLKSLNIGVPLDIMEEGVTNANAIKMTEGNIRGLEELNIQGCNKADSQYSTFLSNTEKLSKLYAIGTNLSGFTSNNYRDEDNRIVYVGGHYSVLQLPSSINTLEFHDTSWTEDNNETDPSDSVGLTFWEYDQTLRTINKVDFVDTDVKTLRMYGTTLRNECAIKLLKEFIAKAYNDTDPGEYTLYFEGLNFDYEELGMTFTYTELMRMAMLNGGHNAGPVFNYKGYLKLSDIESESQSDINAKTQLIIAAFGSSVFTKNSQNTNLVVDFRVAGENQIFITLSDDGKGYFDPSTGTVTEGYQDNAKENPNYLIVRASRFLLPPNKPTQDICIVVNGGEYQDYQGAKVVSSGDLKLLIPEMMRDNVTKQTPNSLRIKVVDHTVEDGVIVDTIGYADVNIAHKLYPTSIGVSLTNSENYKCFSRRNASGNVEATLNTASGVLNISLNYPVDTPDADKVSVKGIEVTPNSEYSRLSLVKNDDGSYSISYNSNIPTSDNKDEFILNCHINYASGDDNDDFQIRLTVMQDEAIVTNSSNSSLYNVLSNYTINGEPIPCMYDTNNNKVFTRSSLNSIDDVIFYTDDTESTFYTALANLSSFLVDTGNTSKGNLFDYINNKTKVINLNGCTNDALASNVTTIDASRFSGSDNGAIYGLQQFICTTNALIEFIFVPNGTNSTLTNITIAQGRKIIVKDLTRINPFNVQNARYVELENLTKISPSNFTLTLDVANLEKLYLNDVIKDTGGVKLLKYVYDYISQNPVPDARDISINWAGTINLTLQTSNPNISDFLDKLADYVGVHGTSQITLNGFLKLDYHSKSLKQDIERYYPGNSLVSNWGTEIITIVPSSLENFVKGKIGNNINTSLLHDGNPNFHIDDIINEERDSSYAATSSSTERAQVRNLLWMLHVKGASLPQYVNMNTVFPNIDYLGWPSTGLSSARDTGTGDSDYDFEFGRYGGLKAKVIVTTCTRPLHNRNNGGSTDLYYRMILFPLAYLNNWYDIISHSVANVQTDLTSEDDKITALANIHMYCKDENGVGYTETSLKNLTEEQLGDMLTTRGFSSFRHYEIGAKDGAWTVA